MPDAVRANATALWWILGLGLALRLLTLWLMPDQNFPDALAYISAGRDLAASGQMRVDAYMPLYPIWTWIWGGGVGLRLADIALSVVTIWVIHELTLEIVDDSRAARGAALAAAIYPHFIFYSVSGLTETAYLLLMCGAFLLFYRQRFFWGSVLLVLSILIRPTADFLAPLLILAFSLLISRERGGVAIRRLVVYAAIYVVLMSPWWAHNYAKYHAFVRLDLGDGMVLYSGNNPINESGGGVSGGAKGDDVDLGRFAGIADPIARNEAMRSAAVAYIRDNPGRFVELAALKFVRFWRLWPYAPEYEQPAIIVISLLSYGVVLALALVFMADEGRARWRRISPVLLWVAYLTAVHMITIGSIRYRLPLEPFLIVFAARAVTRLAARAPQLDRLLKRAAL